MEALTSKNVTAIITTHDDYEKTLACLEKIHEQSDLPQKIIVVDNASHNSVIDTLLTSWKKIAKKYEMDEPVEVFSQETTSARLILLRLSKNEGYSAAINTAIKMGLYDKDCSAFWLMHNDTLPENYALSALLNHTTEEIKKETVPYHIIGATILSLENTLIQCAGGGTFSHILGKTRLYEENISRYSLPDRETCIKNLDFIYGASMLVRREVFEQIGFFAEKFFLFFEDIEFSIRATKAGFKLNWAPGAIITHIGLAPGRATPVRAFNHINEKILPQLEDYYNIRNRFYLLKKLHPFSYILSLLTLPIPLSIRWFKGHKSRFNTVIKAALDGIKMA